MEFGLTSFEVGDILQVERFSDESMQESYKDNYGIIVGDIFTVYITDDNMKYIRKGHNMLLAGGVCFIKQFVVIPIDESLQ